MKYYCTICKKEIEEQEFQKWNEKQRELDKNNLKIEIQNNKKPKLTPEERLRIWKETRTKYYNKNREKIIASVKEWRDKNKQKKRQQDRLATWRKKQKFLALQMLRDNLFKV